MPRENYTKYRGKCKANARLDAMRCVKPSHARRACTTIAVAGSLIVGVVRTTTHASREIIEVGVLAALTSMQSHRCQWHVATVLLAGRPLEIDSRAGNVGRLTIGQGSQVRDE